MSRWARGLAVEVGVTEDPDRRGVENRVLDRFAGQREHCRARHMAACASRLEGAQGAPIQMSQLHIQLARARKQFTCGTLPLRRVKVEFCQLSGCHSMQRSTFLYVLFSNFAVLGASASVLAVGPGKTCATPCRAFAAAKDGDLIEITGHNTCIGDVCAISRNNLTIRGVNGRPTISANGANALAREPWVESGSNILIDNVEMYGAQVPDHNGAALRLEGTNFTLRSASFTTARMAFLAVSTPPVKSSSNTASSVTTVGEMAIRTTCMLVTWEV
ncbi:MAG: hypothetical protein JWR65_3814 [Massilia sp.]|jgi:hypothetical protein|nr:hypothetical protein [Massilia sp.]